MQWRQYLPVITYNESITSPALCNQIHKFLNQFFIIWLAPTFTNDIVPVCPTPGTPVDQLKSLFRMVSDPCRLHKPLAAVFSVTRDFAIYMERKQAKGAMVSVSAVWYGQYLSFTILTDECCIQYSFLHKKSPPFLKNGGNVS